MSDYHKRAHEAVERAIRNRMGGTIGLSIEDEAHAAIDAIPERGHAQHCWCHDNCEITAAGHKASHPHPHRDPRCVPFGPSPIETVDKILHALDEPPESDEVRMNQAYAEGLAKAESPMACGHPVACQGVDGCRWCKDVRPLPEPQTEGEMEFRQRLWLGHGHTGVYGDDGEMQCARCAEFGCMDYKRGGIEDVVNTCIRAIEAQRVEPLPEEVGTLAGRLFAAAITDPNDLQKVDFQAVARLVLADRKRAIETWKKAAALHEQNFHDALEAWKKEVQETRDADKAARSARLRAVEGAAQEASLALDRAIYSYGPIRSTADCSEYRKRAQETIAAIVKAAKGEGEK